MKKEIIIPVIAFVAGSIVAGAVASFSVNSNNHQLMALLGIKRSAPAHEASHMTMADASESLAEKSGDDFDKLFLSSMILHHKGAVQMSELAAERAKHPEVKNLATSIIKSQNKEIEAMHQWEHDWQYVQAHATPTVPHTPAKDNHSH